jgi:hypothetical protein
VRPLLAALVAALVVPAASQAKGVSEVALCGPDECRDAGAAAVRTGPLDTTRSGLAPAPGPYYELRLSFEHGGHSQGMYYEPRSGLASYSEDFGTTAWAPLAPPLAAAVKETAKRLTPFPAPEITAVYVGDRRVAGDPSTYLRLFGIKGPFLVPAAAAKFDWIRFESPDANPWTQNVFGFYPENGVLLTGHTYVKLPPPVAADIAAARPLRDRPDGGMRIPWLAIGTAVAGVVLLLGRGLRRASSREVAPVH